MKIGTVENLRINSIADIGAYLVDKENNKVLIPKKQVPKGAKINDFVDIQTGKRIQVPDGIAHYLEHKLFEKEGANALDLFSQMGVSSNAYTSFDQTVYYFETADKFEESVEMLVKLIKEPYFTAENVEKERGIIGQEISMYDDNPNFKVYFNALHAMYQKNPVRIDIAGTIETISHITHELLYTCYNTFYSPQNMFFIIVGDVDVDKTLDLIEENINKYPDNLSHDEVQKFIPEEPKEIAQKEIEERMDIYLPQLCIGYKLEVADGYTIQKNEVLADVVSEMYFSKQSDFFLKLYNSGKVNSSIDMQYEGSKYFSHIMLMTTTTSIDEVQKELLEYINKIKVEDVDKSLFEMIKRKKIGETILSADSLNIAYRRIIDGILYDTDTYIDVEILKNLKPEDIKEFLNNLREDNQVVSRILPKE